MSTQLARQAIAAPLAAYVTANNLPVDWPNRVFTKPASGPWLRFALLDTLGKQMEMGSPGNNTDRVYGSLVLQAFVPADSGDGSGMGLCDAIGKLYQQKSFVFADSSGHVRFRNYVVKSVGRSDAYWQMNIFIPFYRDELG